MFNHIEFQVCCVILALSILTGFIPKMIKAWQRCRRQSAIKKSKQNFRNINDYDDYDEDLYVMELEKDEYEISKLRMNPESFDENGKPKANFLMNAISLVIGFQSTVTLIGLPVEFYYHGFKSLQITLSIIFAPIIIAVFFVPFIYRIKSNSIYEYLDDKFNDSKSVKYFTVLLMIMFQLTFASLVLYSTSNTIMQIISLKYSSIVLWPIVVVLGLTSFGLALLGLKSVIWASFFQYLIMIFCNIVVIVLGVTYFEGNESESFIEGAKKILNITEITGRAQIFDFKENFRSRYTFWNGLIGLTFNVIPTYCMTQQSYMRIKQAKSLKSAQWLVLTIIPFGFLNMFLVILLGSVIFAYFYVCGDPLSNGSMKNQNQLLPRFLTQFYNQYTGLLGLYMALLISSAINTIASSLKGLSVTLSEDVIGDFMKSSKKSSSPSRYSSYKVRRLSEKYGFSQEEEILNFQIRYNTSRNRRKLLKEYARKNSHRPDPKSVLIVTILNSALIILISICLEKSSDSLTSTALSILNTVHGPLLFIYLCARFNEYSDDRNNYAHNRSTISKLNNLYIHYFDVVTSCIISISFLMFLFFGRMYTYAEHQDFYKSDRLPVMAGPNFNVSSNFCNINNNQTIDMPEYVPFSKIMPDLTNYTVYEAVTPDLINLNYVLATSFNWIPFIGFFLCVFMLFLLSLFRFIYYRILAICFKCS